MLSTFLKSREKGFQKRHQKARDATTIWNLRGKRYAYIFFCFKIRIARALIASCAGPGLVFLICSRYLKSSPSSFFIFSSTVSPRLFICTQIHRYIHTYSHLFTSILIPPITESLTKTDSIASHKIHIRTQHRTKGVDVWNAPRNQYKNNAKSLPFVSPPPP